MKEIVKRLPLQCPSCDTGLKVVKLRCEKCETEVGGNFDLPTLARLDEKEQAFIVDFVKASGSLKEMAKNRNISYPTVRNLLDDLIEKLNTIESPS